MPLPKIEIKKTTDWILATSIIMFFLGVTGGAYGLEVAQGQEDAPYVIGALLLIIWIGLRFYPPKPIERRNQSEITDTKERRRADD